MIHAMTEEREILDNLLTDPKCKQMDREFLEDLIERIASPLIENLVSTENELSDLEEEAGALRDAVATYRMFLTNLKLGIDELVGE